MKYRRPICVTGLLCAGILVWHYLVRPHFLPHPLCVSHGESAQALAFSPDGRKVAAVREDGIEILDGRTLHRIRILTPGSDRSDEVRFSWDGSMVASTTPSWSEPFPDDYSVKLWDVPSGKLRHKLVGHRKDVRGLAFSPDDRLLATGDDTGLIKIWDTRSGRPTDISFRQEDGKYHQDEIYALCFSPEGRQLASAGGDGIIRVWDIHSRRLFRTLSSPGLDEAPDPSPVMALDYVPSSGCLRSLSEDGEITEWNARVGKLLRTFPPAQRVEKACFSADHQTVAIGDWSSGLIEEPRGGVSVQSTETGKPLLWITEDIGVVQAVAISGNGHVLAVASASRHDKQTISLWSVP